MSTMRVTLIPVAPPDLTQVLLLLPVPRVEGNCWRLDSVHIESPTTASGFCFIGGRDFDVENLDRPINMFSPDVAMFRLIESGDHSVDAYLGERVIYMLDVCAFAYIAVGAGNEVIDDSVTYELSLTEVKPDDTVAQRIYQTGFGVWYG